MVAGMRRIIEIVPAAPGWYIVGIDAAGQWPGGGSSPAEVR